MDAASDSITDDTPSLGLEKQKLTNTRAGNAKSAQPSHDAKDVVLDERREFDIAAILVLDDLVEVDLGAPRLEDLLVLQPQARYGIASTCVSDGGRWLEGQVVKGLRGLRVGHAGRGEGV